MSYKSIYLISVILLVQLYFPLIYIYDTTLSIDLVIVLLSVYGIRYKRAHCILLGFFCGLLQDLISQVNLLGAFAIAKSISGYALGSLHNYNTIWKKFFKYIYIFTIYLIHNSIYYYLKLYSLVNLFPAIKLIILQSIISLLLLELINIFIYNKKLIK